MRGYYKYFLTVLIAASLLPCLSWASPRDLKIPSNINYYARLKDADGKFMNGRVTVKAFLYDSATEGMSGDLNDEHLIYAEDHGDVNVTKGRLTFTFGGGEPMGPFSGSSFPVSKVAEAGGLFLELQIGTERLSPRQWIGFTGTSYGAAYAARATDLAGPLSITTSSFPADMSAGKIDCSGSSSDIAPERLPSVQAGTITTGEIPLTQVPYHIPLSKLSSAGGFIASGLLPNVSALKVTSGTFGTGQLPANVIGSDGISKDAAAVASGSSSAVSGTNCHCMASLHSTRDGGDENMNDVNVNMPLTGGTVTCSINFDEGTTKPCNASYMCLCVN